MINPATGQEDPNYVDPTAPTGIGTTPPTTTAAPTTTTPGLISATPPSTAAQWNVTDQQTVENRIKGLISADSPLMQQAAAKATGQMNAKGLLNSSMAVGAGQDAVMSAALPIAQQDATTYANAAAANAGYGQQIGLAEQQQSFNVANMDKAAGIALGMYDTQLQGDMAKMATEQGFNLETMDAKQINDLAKASIMQGYDLTKMDTAAAQALDFLDASTLADIEKMAEANGFDLAKMDAQQINDLAKASIMQGYDLTKMDTAAAQALDFLDASTLADIEKMAEANGFDLAKMDAQQINDLAKMSVDNQYKMDLLTADNDAKALLAKLDNENKIDLADIQSDYQTLLGTNKTAADMFTSVLTNITSIQNDTKIDGLTMDANGQTAKDRAIETQTNMLQAALGVIGGVAEMDLAGLLGFDETTPGMDMAGAIGAINDQNAAAGADAADLAARQAEWDAAPEPEYSENGFGSFNKRVINGVPVERPT